MQRGGGPPRKKSKQGSEPVRLTNLKAKQKNSDKSEVLNNMAGSSADLNNNIRDTSSKTPTVQENAFVTIQKQNPLMNTVVLWNMFELMEPEDLKICRLVSKTWAYVASRFLAERTNVFIYCGKSTFHCSRRRAKPLKQFQSCVSPKQKGTAVETFINFKHLCVLNFEFSVVSHDTLFIRCGKFITSLYLERISEQDCNYLLTCIYYNLRNLKELKIICLEEYVESNLDNFAITQTIPEDHPIPLQLQCFSFTNTDEETLPSFNWKTFFKLSPKLEELELNATFEPLCNALEVYNLHFNRRNMIRKLLISLEKDDFVDGTILDRSRLSNILKVFVPLTQIKEMKFDLNLSAPQLKQIFHALPKGNSLTRLSLHSDWCLGTWYPENEANQPMMEGSLDYFLSCFGKCQNLKELILDVHAGKIENKKIKMLHANHSFPCITSLSWIFKRKYGWSWQTACPHFFNNMRTVFPNLICLKTTVDNKRSFRELFTAFPNLKELTISQFSKYKVQDSDLTGDGGNHSDDHNARRGRSKKTAYQGIHNFKKLQRLRLECDNSKLTNVSIFSGFLLLPELYELELFQAKDPMDFGIEAVNALQEKLKNLTILSVPPPYAG